MNILTDLIIPLIALAVSLVFFISANASSAKAKQILEQINTASQTWQNDIMKYVSESLNSDPHIVGYKIYLSKLNLSNSLVPTVEKLSDKLLDDSLSNEKKEVIRNDIKMLIALQNSITQTNLPQSNIVKKTNDSANKPDAQ